MKSFILISFLFIFANLLPAQQSSEATSTTQEAEPARPQAIPVTEITTRADEIYEILSKISSEVEPTEKVKSVEEKLPAMVDSLKVIMANPIYQKLGELSLRVLKNLDQELDIYVKQQDDWKQILVIRSQELKGKGNNLKAMQEVWQATSQLVVKEKAPRAIRSRVTSVISEIKKSVDQLSKRFNTILIQQSMISKKQIEINKLMEQIQNAENDLRGELFVIDSPSFWEALMMEDDTLHLSAQFQESWSEMIRANIAFVEANRDRFYIHIGLYVLLITLMIYLSSKNKRHNLFNENDDLLKASAFFMSRPFSAATLIALILTIWIYPKTTTNVSEFMMLLMLIPVIRLVPGMFPPEIRKSIYFLVALFFIDLMQRNAVGFVLFQRLMLMLVTIGAFGILVWLMRPKSPFYAKDLKPWPKKLRGLAPVVLILLPVSLVSNLIGNVSLSTTITWGIIESSHILVTVYISAAVFSGLITVLIRRRRVRAMQFVTTFAGQMERWAKKTIFFIAFLIWARATLRAFGVYQALSDWFFETLEHTWVVGTIEISVNAIFDFLIIIIATFILTHLIRAFMDMEIFPRLKLPKGLPSAISMMIRYILITLGIFVALSALGMDLSKFGILAGALGVGLGFGMQKIVANFISSLIIAFARLIRVGDTVQYNDVFGNVKEVGVNACTVRAFDGSEVIIPNADLIGNKVTNWTLSDNQRRMQLPVKVAYGSDPHEVLKLLEKVANYHPIVLKDPEPFAIFNGFQEHYLDFTLYYWIPTSEYFPAKNEIALSVHDILKINKIETPRPWRIVSMDQHSPEERLPAKQTGQRKATTRKRNT